MAMNEKARKVNKANCTIAALAERWPQCFFVYEQYRVPLKVGIYKDIAAAGFPIIGLGLALGHYTRNGCYVAALRPGAPRIDLDGHLAGSVTEEHALCAKQKLSQRRLRHRAKPARQAKSTPSAQPQRLSLADLRAAVQTRKQGVA